MSLQVWLPLNKENDFRNQGIQDITIIDTSSQDTEGKLGKCRNYTTTYTNIVENPIAGKSQFTICSWVYPTASNYGIVIAENNSYWQFLIRQNTIYCRDNSVGQTGTRTDKNITAIPLNTWTHLTVVYNQGQVTVYQNAVLKDNLSFPGTALNAMNNFYLGADPDNSATTYPGNCKLNDFRIYDHCLSPKEIELISRGLVLHYPLNQLERTNNLIKDNYFDSTTSPAIRNEVYKGQECYRVTASTWYARTSKGTSPLFPITFKPATQYTMSVDWCERDDNENNYKGSLYLRFKYDDGTSSNIISGSTTWTHASITSTANKTVVGIYTTYGRGFPIYFKNLAIHEGTQELPYYPTFSTVNDLTEYDTSGMNHNGTVVGTVQYTTDSPRFTGSYQLSNNGTIEVPNFLTGLPIKDTTASLWFKPSNLSGNSLLFGTQHGSNQRFYIGHVGTSVGFGIGSSSWSAISGTTMDTSHWYHIVVVVDPNGIPKLYFNSELKDTKPTVNFNITGKLQIGSANSGETYTPGQYSDVRVYKTALSTDQIKELYNTGAMIDNSGDLFSYSFNEISNNICKSEYFVKYKRDIATSQYGEWGSRNGEKSIVLNPARVNSILENELDTSKQYKFDLWIDADNVFTNSTQYQGGFIVNYTDGTNDYVVVKGNVNNPIGFQHKIFYTNKSKTIQNIQMLYATGQPIYLRWDSMIIPVESNTEINKTGIIKTGQFRENFEEAQIGEGDNFDSNQLIEI